MVDYEASQRQLAQLNTALREERRNVLAQWVSVTYDLKEEDVKAEVENAVPASIDNSNNDLLREKEELQKKLADMEMMLQAATSEAEKEDRKAAADIKIPTSEEVGLSTTGVMIQTDAAAQRLEKELKDQRLKQNKILQVSVAAFPCWVACHLGFAILPETLVSTRGAHTFYQCAHVAHVFPSHPSRSVSKTDARVA
jgi:hypothetical protein